MSYIRSTVSPEALDISDDGQNVHIHSGVTDAKFTINSDLFKTAILYAKKCIKANKPIYISFNEIGLKETWIDVRSNKEVDIDEVSLFDFTQKTDDGRIICNYKEVVRLSYRENYIDMYLATLYYLVFANFR